MKKLLNTIITIASFIFMLMCFGNIQKDIYPFVSLLVAIASMLILARQAYNAGWFYECFYEEEE